MGFLTIILTLAVATASSDSFFINEVFSNDGDMDVLEELLSDGYPMPWLQVLLDDNSIPEDDRYWLDCRIRGYIAENLHTFFREDGSPRKVPCDWMSPGENYWREILIINPIGDAPEVLLEGMPRTYRESGVLVDLYGNKIGTIAITDSTVRLSRDGTLGVAITGWRRAGYLDTYSEEAYFCILLSDGSFIEIPYEDQFKPNGSQYNVSQDGSIIVLGVSDFREDHQLSFYNETGELVFSLPMEGRLDDMTYPFISPDNKFIAVVHGITTGGSTGELIEMESGSAVFDSWMAARFPQFSPNSERVAFCGQEEPIYVLSTTDLTIQEEYQQDTFFTSTTGFPRTDFLLGVSICNTEGFLLASWNNHSAGIKEVDLYFNGAVQERYPNYNEGMFSPNGSFVWLADPIGGQGSTWHFYGSKCLILHLGIPHE